MNTKLANFEKVVFDDANKKAKEILAAAEKTAEEIIVNAQKQAKTASEEIIKDAKNKADKKYASSVASSSINAKRELILKRSEYVDEMFRKIESKLIEFTKTDDYKHYLLNAVSSAKSGMSEDAVIEVRADDEQLCKELFSKDEVKTVNDIKVGGVRIIFSDAAVMFDKTFDEALIDEKSAFISASGLTLD